MAQWLGVVIVLNWAKQNSDVLMKHVRWRFVIEELSPGQNWLTLCTSNALYSLVVGKWRNLLWLSNTVLIIILRLRSQPKKTSIWFAVKVIMTGHYHFSDMILTGLYHKRQDYTILSWALDQGNNSSNYLV